MDGIMARYSSSGEDSLATYIHTRLSLARSVSFSGSDALIAARHGAHQVFQKSTSTTFPL